MLKRKYRGSTDGSNIRTNKRPPSRPAFHQDKFDVYCGMKNVPRLGIMKISINRLDSGETDVSVTTLQVILPPHFTSANRVPDGLLIPSTMMI